MVSKGLTDMPKRVAGRGMVQKLPSTESNLPPQDASFSLQFFC